MGKKVTRIWQLPLSKKMLFALFGLLTPVILLQGVMTAWISSAFHRETQRANEQLFSAYVEEVERQLDSFRILSYNLSADADIAALFLPMTDTQRIFAYQEYMQKLQFLARSNNSVASVSLYLVEEEMTLRSDVTVSHGPVSAAEQDLIQESGYQGLWRVVQSSDSNTSPYFAYQRYVSGLSGTASDDYILSIDIRSQNLESILSSISFDGQGDAFLFLSDAEDVLFSGSSNPAGVRQVQNEVQRRISEGLSSGHFSLESDPNIQAHYQMVCNGSGYICFYYDRQTVFSSMNQLVGISLLLMVVSFGFAAFLVIFIYKGVFKPIRTVITAMDEISRQNLSISLPDRDQDDVGAMYRQFNIMAAELNRQINEVYLQKIKNQQMQLAAYQSQINPHFLYNCLNFIAQSAASNEDEYSEKMAVYLSRYFHYAIGSIHQDVTLGEEMENVENYVRIQNIRFSGKIHLETEIPPEARALPLPRLIIQPIVENSIVHGRDSGETVCIRVCGGYENGVLTVAVADNNGSLDEAQLEQLRQSLNQEDGRDRIGLRNIHERLQIKYGAGSGLSLDLVENSLRVTLKIVYPTQGQKGEDSPCTTS